MWLFTTRGFVSVVRAPGPGPARLQLRARRRSHLTALVGRMGWTHPIIETPTADYRWRIVVTPAAFAALVVALAAEVAAYRNFKGACAAAVQAGELDGGYEAALHEVWGVMHEYQGRHGGQ